MIKIDTSDCDENEQSNDAEVNIEQLDALRVELNTMAYIQRLQEKPHPNLIRLIGTTTTINQQFCLMTEYCEYGSLDCYLQDKYNSNQFINEIVSNGSETPEGKVIWKVKCIKLHLCIYSIDFKYQ
jgi:serine/threonine protein kinase